jgi:anti-sigma B factor antagonist
MFETRRQGAVQVLTGDEPIHAATIGQLDSQLIACLSYGQPKVVIDLERVPLLDSAGLEWLVDAAEKCFQRGGQIQLAAPSALCSDILRITGVGEQVEVFDDVTSAVRSFSR